MIVSRRWFTSPSGRLHWGNSCSGGLAPHKARAARPTVADLERLMAADRRPGICRCGWRAAERQIREGGD